MIKFLLKTLSAYHIQYPINLVYILQTTEYNIREYLKWILKTDSFINVQKRKKLKITLKTFLLLILLYIFIILTIFAGYIFITSYHINTYLLFIISLLTAIILPYLIAFFIIIPVFIIQIFQKNFEYLVLYNIKKKVSKYNGIKIAIVGSFGKTTMREILRSILSISKKTASPQYNYNTPIGILRFLNTLKLDEDILIFEFGEYYPGDIKKLCKAINPNIGIITGINEAHLQKFKTIDNTIKTIYEIAEFFQSKPLYINGESKYATKNKREYDIIYTKNNVNNWIITNQYTDIYGTSFTMSKGNKKLDIKTKLLGLHQIGPIAAAIDIADNIGIKEEDIIKGTLMIKPFEHRMQPIYNDDGWILIDDSYNGNPDGAKAAIDFLSSLQGYRRYYVTPGFVEMGDKSKDIHIYLGNILGKSNIEKVILIKTPVSKYIEQGLKESNFKGELIYFKNMLEFLQIMPNIVVKNDIILIQNDWPDHYYFTN